MREYYDQWEYLQRDPELEGPHQGRRPPAGDTRGRPLSADAETCARCTRSRARFPRGFSGGAASHPKSLYPPPPQRAYRCDGYGDYIFAVSRLAPLKRLSLLIRGAGDIRKRRASAASLPAKAKSTRRSSTRSSAKGLSSRVTLIGRIDDSQMLDHLAKCRAVCFPPYDEDYGFVTVEAFASRKPVVTCSDSGGPAELVVDDVNGKVCAPRPEALAVALRELMDDAAAAERMGQAGLHQVSEMTWSRAVAQLLTT